MGTLAAVPLYGLLQFLPMPIYFLVVLLAFVVGIYLCGKTAQWMGEHDHGGIVWDEFVGFWITMALVPAHWLWVLLGFVYFRVFDIAKPWPISWLDRRVHGGLGIMIDDVLAGVAAALCLYATVYFLG